jgi:hypothetical protein
MIPATWWVKAAAAGMVGGVASALSWSIGSALAGRGFWTPLNAIGTTMPGADTVTPALSTYTVSGAFLHLLTAFCWGVVFGAALGLIVPRFGRSMGRTVVAGLGFGVVTWLIMGLVIGPLFDPRIFAIQRVNYFIGHLVFGTVTAWAFYLMARRRELSISYLPMGSKSATDRQAAPHR